LTVNRVTYRGVGLFINGTQIDRATAFGASGTINKEDMFEIGNSDIVEVVDDINEVSMTLDANEYGSIKTLAAICGKKDEAGTVIDFATDIGQAGAVSIWNYIKPLGYDDILYTQFMKNCFVNSYSANFVTDGNATESYGFVSDNKKWLLGGNSQVAKVELGYEIGAWVGSAPSTTARIQTVVVNGREITDYTDASTGSEIDVTIPGTEETDSVYAIVSGSTGGSLFVPDKESPAGKRRGHVELYLVTGHTYNGGKITGGTLKKQFRVQSVSIDASLDREDLGQLGYTYYYDRPLVLPIDVTTSFDLTFADLEMFKQFVTESPTGELSIDNFKNDVGMIVRIFDKRDIDADRMIMKELHIPYLIATDEAFNISLDGNATQTFSFRSHELAIKRAAEEEPQT
jgi:hypothetical protein